MSSGIILFSLIALNYNIILLLFACWILYLSRFIAENIIKFLFFSDLRV